MKTHSFKLSFSVPAKPEEVFSALTESRKISKWSGQKGSFGNRVGGKYQLFDGYVKGKIRVFKPGKELAHTWEPNDWPEGSGQSIVKYKLTASKRGTKVVLQHVGFPDAKQRADTRGGWKEFVIDPLNKHFSSAKKR